MEVDLRIFGTEEAVNAFKELTSANQKKVYRMGMRKAGKIILDAARENYSSGKKKGNFKRVEKAFRMEDITDATGNEITGVNVGNTSYIARWQEEGTKERVTKNRKLKIFRKQPKPHSTGKVQGIHFLLEATEAKGEEAVNSIAEYIREAYDKLMTKYARKK